jgi:hypothetical protein
MSRQVWITLLVGLGVGGFFSAFDLTFHVAAVLFARNRGGEFKGDYQHEPGR